MRVQQLAKLMRLHVESGELQERGCTELRRLVAENPENADEVANEALDAVVQAMELHIDIDGIQEMGCSILRRLSGRGGHEATVLQAAGVQVIRTMNMHASNSLLQEHCSAILHHCALGSKGCAELIVSLCGHMAVARAMHRHNKVEVQEQGCMALSVLASVAMGAESGGGGQILQAMRSYPTNMSIQHHGCVALGSMAFYFAKDQALIVRAGGVDAVVQAMRLHPTCPIIQEQGCMALRYLARDIQTIRPELVPLVELTQCSLPWPLTRCSRASRSKGFWHCASSQRGTLRISCPRRLPATSKSSRRQCWPTATSRSWQWVAK